MEVRKLRSLLVLTAVLLSSCSQELQNNTDGFNSDRLDWMKDFAFSQCLHYALGDSLKQQILSKDHSTSTLIDIADIWGDSGQITDFAEAFVDSIPETVVTDYRGKKPFTLRCLEFRRSKELDSLVRSIVDK